MGGILRATFTIVQQAMSKEPGERLTAICKSLKISRTTLYKCLAPVRKTIIYVNNRLEGNALETISAMLKSQH